MYELDFLFRRACLARPGIGMYLQPRSALVVASQSSDKTDLKDVEYGIILVRRCRARFELVSFSLADVLPKISSLRLMCNEYVHVRLFSHYAVEQLQRQTSTDESIEFSKL